MALSRLALLFAATAKADEFWFAFKTECNSGDQHYVEVRNFFPNTPGIQVYSGGSTSITDSGCRWGIIGPYQNPGDDGYLAVAASTGCGTDGYAVLRGTKAEADTFMSLMAVAKTSYETMLAAFAPYQAGIVENAAAGACVPFNAAFTCGGLISGSWEYVGIAIGLSEKVPDGWTMTTCGNDDPCFPSSAEVTKADGTTALISSLKEGDQIVAATADGMLTTDTVSLLSLSKPEGEAPMVALRAGNATLTLTPEHHLPVGPSCCSELKQAKNVVVGDKVWAVRAAAPPLATTVTAKSTTHGKGLHSPVLTHGGFPVVDGLVTSFDSIEKVTLAKNGLSALIATCKISGTCDKFREMFLGDNRKYVEALRRRRI